MTVTRKWIAATAVGAVLILVLAWFTLVHPKNSSAAEARTQTASVQQQTSRLKLTLEQLTSESAQMPQYEAKIAEFAKQIPDQSQLPQMIRQLTTIASQSGVDLDTISPSAMAPYQKGDGSGSSSSSLAGPSTAGGLAQIPIDLKVNGSFASLEEFLSSLEGLQRTFVVSGYTLAPADGGGAPGSVGASSGQLALALSAKMFVLPADGKTGSAASSGSSGGAGSSAAPTPLGSPTPTPAPVTPSGSAAPTAQPSGAASSAPTAEAPSTSPGVAPARAKSEAKGAL